MRVLTIFDLDGTLTRTTESDAICFAEAIAEVFGIEQIDTDWGKYEHVTDSWITRAIVREHFGRDPSPEELLRFHDCERRLFFELSKEKPGQFTPVDGAPEFLREIRARSFPIAIATGAWRVSAETKLEIAGIDWEGIPLVTSDDGLTREDIYRLAERRALEDHSDEPEAKFLFGDGLWDMRTARNLGWTFIPIGGNGIDEKLRNAGVDTIYENYNSIELRARLKI